MARNAPVQNRNSRSFGRFATHLTDGKLALMNHVFSGSGWFQGRTGHRQSRNSNQRVPGTGCKWLETLPFHTVGQGQEQFLSPMQNGTPASKSDALRARADRQGDPANREQ